MTKVKKEKKVKEASNWKVKERLYSLEQDTLNLELLLQEVKLEEIIARLSLNQQNIEILNENLEAVFNLCKEMNRPWYKKLFSL